MIEKAQQYEILEFVEKLANRMGWQEKNIATNLMALTEVGIKTIRHNQEISRVNRELVSSHD